MKKYKLGVIIVNLIIGILWILMNTFNNIDYLLYINKLFVLVIFITSFISSYYIRRKIISAYNFLLLNLFIFCGSRIWLDLIGYKDFGETTFFSSYFFTVETQIFIVKLIFLSVYFVNLGAIFSMDRNESEVDIHDVYWSNYGKKMFYIGCIPEIYKIIVLILNLKENGYVSIFEESSQVNIPIYISFLSMFYLIGFIMYSIGKKEITYESYVINIIFFLITFLQFFTGKRGPAITITFLGIWLISYRYKIKISFKKIFVIGITLMIMSQFILSFRSSKSFEFNENFINNFLYEQGVTVQILGYIKDYDIDEIEFSVSDIFRPLKQSTDIFIKKIIGNTNKMTQEQKLEEYNNYSSVIASRVNNYKFRQGFGLGGTYIAELYLIFGKYGMIIISFIIGILFISIERNIKNKYIFLNIALILPELLYIPRSYLLEFLNTKFRILILANIIILLLEVMKKRSKVIRYEEKNINDCSIF